jgi:hypothetical protein
LNRLNIVSSQVRFQHFVLCATRHDMSHTQMKSCLRAASHYSFVGAITSGVCHVTLDYHTFVFAELLAQAEIADLGTRASLLRDSEYIGWLQVQVQDAAIVETCHAMNNLTSQLPARARIFSRLCLQDPICQAALCKFKHQRKGASNRYCTKGPDDLT